MSAAVLSLGSSDRKMMPGRFLNLENNKLNSLDGVALPDELQ